MQKVLATFYLQDDYNYKYELIQDLKTGKTFIFVHCKDTNKFFDYNAQEFEKDNNINLNDLLN